MLSSMPVVSDFTGITFTLFVWLGTNGLIFVIPGLGWIQYAILLSVETLFTLFVISSIYDASGWKPWKEATERIRQFRSGGLPRRVVVKDFKSYLIHFGSLAFIWSLEIILQKVLFSTVFTTSLHTVDDDGPLYWEDRDQQEPSTNLSLTCMDGTYLFSIRQFVLLFVFVFTAFMDAAIIQERIYLKKTVLPVILMCVGAFSAVLNNQSDVGAGPVFLALLWVLLRASRLILTKWVQRSHMQTITITRFLRLLIPLMLIILVPAFFFTEYRDLSTIVIKGSDQKYSDAQQFAMVVWHLFKVSLYSALFFSSSVLLFFGGNAVDYTSWLMFREVIWNTSCGYVVGTGSTDIHKRSLGQILGLTLFLFAWVTYLVLFGSKYVQRNRQEQYRQVRPISFDSIRDDEVYNNPLVARTSVKYSDLVLEEQ